MDTKDLREDLQAHVVQSEGEAPEKTIKERIWPFFEAVLDKLDLEAELEDPSLTEEHAEVLLLALLPALQVVKKMLLSIPADAPQSNEAIESLKEHQGNLRAAIDLLANLGYEADDEDDDEEDDESEEG